MGLKVADRAGQYPFEARPDRDNERDNKKAYCRDSVRKKRQLTVATILANSLENARVDGDNEAAT